LLGAWFVAVVVTYSLRKSFVSIFYAIADADERVPFDVYGRGYNAGNDTGQRNVNCAKNHEGEPSYIWDDNTTKNAHKVGKYVMISKFVLQLFIGNCESTSCHKHYLE
jgi:hypothetical protein